MGMKKMVEMEIEKKNYGFRLSIGNESYFINDKGSFYTLVIENEEREMIDAVDDKYENLGVKNADELLCKLIKEPQTVLEMLIGKQIAIEKITVEFD